MANRLLIQDHSYVQSSNFADGVVAADLSFRGAGSTDPYGLCADNSGNIYISDPYQHVILKISPAGKTQHFAGRYTIFGGFVRTN